MLIFAFAIGFVSGTFLTTRYHFTVYVMSCLVLDQRCQLRVHFFTKIQIQIFNA